MKPYRLVICWNNGVVQAIEQDLKPQVWMKQSGGVASIELAEGESLGAPGSFVIQSDAFRWYALYEHGVNVTQERWRCPGQEHLSLKDLEELREFSR